MAVVFISPKQRQKMFFMIITVMFLLFLAVISFGVFLSKPSAVSEDLVFNKPKINIDMSVFDTDQFKNLQPLPAMNTLYSYKATTKDNQSKIGFISADSINSAQSILEGMGLFIIEIKKVEAGRSNPFIPYYQSIVPPVKSKVTLK